jgi:hypothetical protein
VVELFDFAIIFVVIFYINTSIFINMNLTEAEKKEILSKYDGTTSDELLNHLKRNFPVSEIKFDWMIKPVKQISIDYKTYNIEHNKKYLVGKLTNYLEDEWIHLDNAVLRRTIKKFLDGHLL